MINKRVTYGNGLYFQPDNYPFSALTGCSIEPLQKNKLGQFAKITCDCFQFKTIATNPDDIKIYSGAGGLGLKGSKGVKGNFYAKADADVFWSDGTKAGITIDNAYFDTELAQSNNKRCFKTPLLYINNKNRNLIQPYNYITFCFNQADIN